MATQKTLYAVIALLIAALLVTATVAALYVYRYDQAQDSADSYLAELGKVQPVQDVDFLIDFGNGTLAWSNDTQVPTGASAYVATVLVAHGVVNSSWYPQYGEHLVTGIDNVQNTEQESWFLWTYNSTAAWQVAETGADLLPAVNGSVFAWTFCGYDSTTYAPTCSP